jgi:hypothetical protein
MAAQGHGTAWRPGTPRPPSNKQEVEECPVATRLCVTQRVGGHTGGGSLTAAYHAGSGHCG